VPCLFPLRRPPPRRRSAPPSTACRTASSLHRDGACATSSSALQDYARLLNAALNLSHLCPHGTPGPSSLCTPGFAPSCTAQPPRRADPARVYFTRRSMPPLRTVRPGTVHACELELTVASGLALRVLPPPS
jgi:hypothetical protein